jgi:hypothetical protein
MLQACPGREELQAVTKVSERAVAAYEVLTWHLHRQQEKIEQLKEAIRVRGGCRMLSDGDKCDCGLCTRDNEIERLQERVAQHEAGMDSAGLPGVQACEALTAECLQYDAEIEHLRDVVAAVAFLQSHVTQNAGGGRQPFAYVWQSIWEEFERRLDQ